MHFVCMMLMAIKWISVPDLLYTYVTINFYERQVIITMEKMVAFINGKEYKVLADNANEAIEKAEILADKDPDNTFTLPRE